MVGVHQLEPGRSGRMVRLLLGVVGVGSHSCSHRSVVGCWCVVVVVLNHWTTRRSCVAGLVAKSAAKGLVAKSAAKNNNFEGDSATVG